MTVPTPRIGGRTVRLRAARTLEVDVLPVPEPRAGEVHVRIRAVGICGTDVHGYLGRTDSYPATLGHDAIATVVEVGPDTPSTLAVGDRVVIDPTLACGECAACRAGSPQICRNGGYLGMGVPGVMADHLVVAADRLVPVPDAVADDAATVLEPITVALHLLERIGSFSPPGRRAHVIGGGPLGVLLAQTLEAFSWDATVYEPQPHRREIAQSLGLRVVDPAEMDAGSPGDLGPVLVVETSAAAAGVETARMLAAPGSVVALVGRAPTGFSSAEILLHELTVLGVRAGTGQYARAVQLVADGSVTPAATITHRFDLADAADAFAAVTDSEQHVMRAVLLAS